MNTISFKKMVGGYALLAIVAGATPLARAFGLTTDSPPGEYFKQEGSEEWIAVSYGYHKVHLDDVV